MSLLASTLDHLLDGAPSEATRELDAAFADAPDPWVLALGAFVLFMALDYVAAVVLGDRALLAAGLEVEADPEAVLLARAVRGLASAGHRREQDGPDSWAVTAPRLTPSGDPLADAVGRIDVLDRDTPTAHFIRYLLAEAALANGRLELAESVVRLSGPTPALRLDGHGTVHPFSAMVSVMRSRLFAFRGLITEAGDELRTMRDMRHGPVMSLVIAGTETLVRGNAAERAEVRALADRLELARPRPVDYLSVGCYLLVAFGLSAVGDVRRSARLALFAGTDSLDLLNIVDRGLTLELLIASAADESDLDAAEAWRTRAVGLEDSPICGSTVARLNARVELLAGRPDGAVLWAGRAVEQARAEGRIVELIGGELLLELARSGGAGGEPQRIAVAAGRVLPAELRASGRSRPAAGSDWQGLTQRERDIALMISEGMTNREIGWELHLSEHTVRAHVSRVLAAFGAASRFAVAARIAELFPAPGPVAPTELTPRQSAVAGRIAAGLGNAEIGRDLGLSVKTVEKHIGEIFRRWNVNSRVGIARIVRSR